MIAPNPNLCALCLRPRPMGMRKHCSRACSVRSADLRRRGSPTIDPGYRRRPHSGGSLAFQRTQSYVDRALYNAIKAEHWDEAHEFEVALEALKRVAGLKKARTRI